MNIWRKGCWQCMWVLVLCGLLHAPASLAATPLVVQALPAQDAQGHAAAPEGAWADVSLPHVATGDTWYRVFFDVEARNSEAWAAYVPYLYGGGALWLNGVALSQIPSSGAQTTVRWERPFLLTFSDELLRPGRNELLIRVSASSSTHARMPRLEIGPFSTLHDKYEQRRFWVRTMPQYTVLSCFLVGSLALFIWWRRREELLYGLFGMASILWGWRTLTFLVESLPSAVWPFWRVLYYTTTGGFIILLLIFSLRLAGTVRPRIEQALLLYWLLGPLAYGLSGGSESLVGKLWQGGTIPMGLAILVACTVAALRQRTGPLIALALAIAMAVAAGVHDYLLATTPISGHASAGWFGHRIYLLHYGADLVLLVMGAILATRFVGALYTVEQLNQTLEARVQDRERTLQANYIQMHALERQQAVSEERRRIMRDLHDGLGSRLFVALSRVEAGEIEHEGMAQTLRDCIADMRLALEVMSPAENDFMEAWGSFRFRWDRQLQQAGLQTHWRVRSEREPMALSAEAGMQLLRIAQEALTNVLKHARARQVNIELLCTRADVCLSVSDDGTSFSAANSAHGRGLANMRARAQKLGGELHLDAGPAGTRIDLRFPYVEAPSRA